MKKHSQLPLVEATVSPLGARKLLVNTMNRIIGDEDFIDSESAPYAGEYVGWLIDYFAQQDEEWTALTDISGTECTPVVSIGYALFMGKAAMREMYGTLRLDGSDPAFDPTTFDSAPKDELDAAIAACSDGAVAAVWGHMAAAYQDMITGGSVTS